MISFKKLVGSYHEDFFQKSIDMSAIYRKNPKVEAIILSGSVSKNLQDEHSDIELHILWLSSPTDEDLRDPIEEAKGTTLSYHPYEEEEWSKVYLDQDGIKFEISSFLSTTADRFIPMWLIDTKLILIYSVL